MRPNAGPPITNPLQAMTSALQSRPEGLPTPCLKGGDGLHSSARCSASLDTPQASYWMRRNMALKLLNKPVRS